MHFRNYEPKSRSALFPSLANLLPSHYTLARATLDVESRDDVNDLQRVYLHGGRRPAAKCSSLSLARSV